MNDFRTLTILVKGSPDVVTEFCNVHEGKGWEVKVICPSRRRDTTYVVFECEVIQ